MNKNFLTIVVIAVIIITIGIGLCIFFSKNEEGEISLESQKTQEIIRQAAAAGTYYLADKEELKNQVDQFLAQAELSKIQGLIRALIVPHAGHIFSGQIAAYGYKLLSEKLTQTAKEPITVILIGSSHQQYIKDVVIDGSDVWQTPLGEVEIDKELRDSLTKVGDLFKIDAASHQNEHSLEVQVPFLQQTLSNFKILPILVNELTERSLESISQTLAENMDKNTVIIASSDMSHYPSYADSNYADKKVIDAILTGRIEELEKTIARLEKENIPNAITFLCAEPAVKVVMKVAQKIEAKNINLLKYANSGDVAVGDKSRVVGYSSIVFTSERLGPELNLEEQKRLLEIARQSVESYIKTKTLPEFKEDSFFLNRKLGAFVTLKKYGQLRGCIGRFSPTDVPLYQVVSQMAVAAATQDIRFYPVQASDLKDLEYEISVLSPLKKIKNLSEIEIGRHGVQIKRGLNSGVFLPQVATENNWGLEEFLGTLCQQKAGLPANCWKDKNTELYVFTAQVFGEK